MSTDENGYVIEHGVPISKGPSGKVATVRQMKVGDSVLVPTSEGDTWYMAGKYCGKKMSRRRISESQTRMWIVEDKSKASV